MTALPADVAAALREYGVTHPDAVQVLSPDRAWGIDELAVTLKPDHGGGSTRKERLEAADRLLRDLHGTGYPCPEPLPRADGAYVTALGDRFLQVATRISGGHHPWQDRTVATAEEAGQYLGRLHAFQLDRPLPTIEPADLTARSLMGLKERAAEIRDAALPDGDRLLALLETAERDIVTLDASIAGLPSGLCHHDFSPGNVIFEGDTLVAVLDFELLPAPWMTDLAFALIYWCVDYDTETDVTTIDDGRAAALIAGYSREKTPIADERTAFTDVLTWTAIRWWSRQAAQRPTDPLWRLRSRGSLYTVCRNLPPGHFSAHFPG